MHEGRRTERHIDEKVHPIDIGIGDKGISAIGIDDSDCHAQKSGIPEKSFLTNHAPEKAIAASLNAMTIPQALYTFPSPNNRKIKLNGLIKK